MECRELKLAAVPVRDRHDCCLQEGLLGHPGCFSPACQCSHRHAAADHWWSSVKTIGNFLKGNFFTKGVNRKCWSAVFLLFLNLSLLLLHMYIRVPTTAFEHFLFASLHFHPSPSLLILRLDSWKLKLLKIFFKIS